MPQAIAQTHKGKARLKNAHAIFHAQVKANVLME